MTDTVATQNLPAFHIHRIYLKGCSLEMPHAPKIFLEQGEIKMDVQLNPAVNDIGDGNFDVALRATLTAKLGDKVLYLLEVDQAGIFELQNIPAADQQMLLEVKCPEILTSYIRTQLADTLSRAQMPPFLLPEINWGQAFMERQQANVIAANESVH